MPYVPGNAADGYCKECKKDTVHTILSVEGFQVRLARCEKCGTEAPLTVSRTQTKAGLRAALTRKAARTGTAPRRSRKPRSDPAQTFRSVMSGKDIASARDYNVKLVLEQGDVVRHKRFGMGVVTGIAGPQKVIVTFEDGPRTMAFGL